jgi:Flp pilus assembly pilin Flp
MKRLLESLSKDDAANGSLESAVLAIGLALALAAVVAQIGGALNTAF